MAEAQVLVVEDDNIIAMDIKSRLQALGYAVSAVVFSGQEAIEKAAETQPDLVLMDIRLRGHMDGVEAAEIPAPLALLVDTPELDACCTGDDGCVNGLAMT